MDTDLLLKAIKSMTGMNITSAIAEITLNSIKSTQKKIEEDPEVDIDVLEKEVIRTEAINSISASQARVAQELAIARRIDSAEEVEIEEFYEGIGDGGVGVSSTQGDIKIGVHGSGGKITRRIYRFKGFRDGEKEVYNQILTKNDEDTDN